MNPPCAHSCYLCGNALAHCFDSTDYITGETFSVYRCNKCSLCQTIPHLSTAELSPYYAGVYYKQRKSVTDTHINKWRLRQITHAVKSKRTGRKILDIGCGNGALIDMLIQNGWDAEGTEVAPPEHFVSEAVRQQVYIGEFTNASFPPNSFSVATIWHVLEHVSDPRSYIKELHRTQKESGLLIIEVPNIDSWQAWLTGRHWFNLDVPRHVFHFTPKSLSRLLTEEGYRVIKISHYSAVYSFYGMVQSLLNMATRRGNILFDILNHKISFQNYASHGIKRWEMWVTLLLTLPYALVSVPLTIAESLFKKGGIITVYAEHV